MIFGVDTKQQVPSLDSDIRKLGHNIGESKGHVCMYVCDLKLSLPQYIITKFPGY